ncbi:MAG: DUF456 domain-containing protein [Ignavibacteria bacterium]|nr:MAG: DUF456 domain-containing protein [Ignavibacteria bacterium]
MIETVIIIVIILLTLVGIVGCILPVLPGPPINYAALLIAYFYFPDQISEKTLILFGVLAGITLFSDYIINIWGYKKFGLSRLGFWGALLGMIIGIFFFPPVGMILGSFVGAVVGELIVGKNNSDALKSGVISFFLNLLGIFFKLFVSILIGFWTFKAIM